MDRGAWWATVHGVCKELDMTEWPLLFILLYYTKLVLFKAFVLALSTPCTFFTQTFTYVPSYKSQIKFHLFGNVFSDRLQLKIPSLHITTPLYNSTMWYGVTIVIIFVFCLLKALLRYTPHIINAAKSLQSCPTLCDPVDGSPPGFPIPGILQARTLEWVAISFSNAWKWKVKVKSLSRVRPSATSWAAAFQAPPSMGFSRQEYWSGVPLPSPLS